MGDQMNEIIARISTCALNFRPLGGVNPAHHIFRSGSFSHLPESVFPLLKEQVGITHLFDLRTVEETGKNPVSDTCERYGIKLISLPLGDFPAEFRTKRFLSPRDYAHYYEQILENGQSALHRLFSTLLYELGFRNFVFGCHAGKDRTGVVAYLLLSLAGTPLETIVRDYVLSTPYIHDKLAFFRSSWEKRGLTPEAYVKRIEARPETMRLFNRSVQANYGGAENYLHMIGFSWKEIAIIKKCLE